MRAKLLLASVLVAITGAVSLASAENKVSTSTQPANSPYLFLWGGDAERKSSDYLAVVDADPASRTYGKVLTSVPVNASGTMPHHTEYEFSSTGELVASGWVSGRAFIFDLKRPTAPRLLGSFGPAGEYIYPHSFARTSKGGLFAVYQSRGKGYKPGGGLVELDSRGKLVRAVSAHDPGVNEELIWPYSLEVDEKQDRIVTTLTPMGMPPWATLPPGSWPLEKIDATVTRHIQVFTMSDLRRLTTLELPASGRGKHAEYPAEPRRLADGSMYVNTFRCGLYHLTGLEGTQPKVRLVHVFPGGEGSHNMCAVPVVLGKYWIQTVGSLPGLIALDISNPEKPVEVARLQLGPEYHMPHWLAADRRGNRVVLTGGEQSWVLIVNVDRETGKLKIDERFKDEVTGKVGVNLTRERWPHGGGGKAEVHGALFGPR